ISVTTEQTTDGSWAVVTTVKHYFDTTEKIIDLPVPSERFGSEAEAEAFGVRIGREWIAHNTPRAARPLGEDPQLEVARRHLVERVQEGGRPEIGDARVPARQLADLLVGVDHRLLEPRVDEIDFARAVRDALALFVGEQPARRLLDCRHHAVVGGLFESL